MEKRTDIKFVRIRGRIVPIRQKQATGASQIAAGTLIASASAAKAASLVKDSWKSYGRSANIRGGIKLIRGRVPSIILNQSYKDAARFSMTGKVLAKRGFGLLSLGVAAGGALASVGASKFADKQDTKQMLSDFAAGVLVSGISVAIFKKKVGIKKAAGVIQRAGSIRPKDLLKSFSSTGAAQTRQTVKKYETMIKNKKRTKAEKGLYMLNQQVKKRTKAQNPNQMKFEL